MPRKIRVLAGGVKRTLMVNPKSRVFTTPTGKKLVIRWGKDKGGADRWSWGIRKMAVREAQFVLRYSDL